jgi:hypothetical protein
VPDTDLNHEWDCEAYGPDLRAVGALCFFARELGERVCASPGECRRVMAAERRRVFRRIHELAAQGDDTAAYLAGEFARPEQLLGGEDSGG